MNSPCGCVPSAVLNRVPDRTWIRMSTNTPSGVVAGEVGAGKTVAVRGATAALDTSPHVVIYLPNPSVGVRGILHHIVASLGQVPSLYTAAQAPHALDALAAEHAERGRTPGGEVPAGGPQNSAPLHHRADQCVCR